MFLKNGLSQTMCAWITSARETIQSRLPSGSLRGRLASGAFWSLAATAGYQSLVLLASFVTARLLGKTVFDELGMIQSTVGMLGVFTGMGLGMTATKHVAEFRDSNPDRAGRIIGMTLSFGLLFSGVIALVLICTSRQIAGTLINAPHLALELRIGCLLLVFNTLFQTAQAALAGFEEFRAIAKVNLATGLMSFPLIVGGAYFWQLPGGVSGMALASAFGSILTYLALRRHCRRVGVNVVFHHIREELPVLWSFSLPSFLSGVTVSPMMWAISAILANQPGGYSELGLFNAARQWWLLILFVPNVISRALMPILSERLGTNDRTGALKALLATICFSGAIGVSAATVLTLFSRQGMALFGNSFPEGTLVLVLMAWCGALMTLQSPVSLVIVASGRLWVGFIMNLAWAIALLGAFSLLRQFGAAGLAGSLLIAHSFHTLQMGAYACILFQRNDHQNATTTSQFPKPAIWLRS